jgi:hypothetical protein
VSVLRLAPIRKAPNATPKFTPNTPTTISHHHGTMRKPPKYFYGDAIRDDFILQNLLPK